MSRHENVELEIHSNTRMASNDKSTGRLKVQSIRTKDGGNQAVTITKGDERCQFTPLPKGGKA
jgi:hypothetical protein